MTDFEVICVGVRYWSLDVYVFGFVVAVAVASVIVAIVVDTS